MGNKKILIAFGTRYGSTEEISNKIAKMLEEKGFETIVFNLGINKPKNWPLIEDFDGIIVGTSMKVNAWKKQVKSFIDRNKTEFNNKKMAFFTCGAYAIAEPIEAKEDIAKRLMKKYELKAEIYEAFGGVVDFSENSKLGRAGRGTLKLMAMGFSKDFGVEFDMNGCNDFRDWDKIRNFADSFISKL